jgi:hypothetical protein
MLSTGLHFASESTLRSSKCLTQNALVTAREPLVRRFSTPARGGSAAFAGTEQLFATLKSVPHALSSLRADNDKCYRPMW